MDNKHWFFEPGRTKRAQMSAPAFTAPATPNGYDRALRPPRGVASANDVMWAFGTRSTESRLQRARELLLAQWEALEEEAAP